MRFEDVVVVRADSESSAVIDASKEICWLALVLSNEPPLDWLECFVDRARHFAGDLFSDAEVEGNVLRFECSLSSVREDTMRKLNAVILPAANAMFRDRYAQELRAQQALDRQLASLKF